MTSREIARSEWAGFFDSFSRQHEGWLVALEAIPGGEGDSCVQAHDLPLQGISLYPHYDSVVITLGKSAARYLTHTVEHPTRVIVEQSDAGIDQGVRINHAHDEATRIRFQHAVRPEDVDGMPRHA